MEGFAVSVGLILVVGILGLVLSVRIVPQGWHYTVERLGRFKRTLAPGLSFIIPVIDRVGRKINMMEQVLDVPRQEIITRDNAMVSVDGVVFIQVRDARCAAYEVVQLDVAILNLVMTNIRTVMGSLDLDELLSQRDRINASLLAVVDEATAPWGVKVTRVEIKDITPPRDLVDSMARQMKAEREKRAAVLEAEGLRAASVLKAEGLKQATILEAEGRREAAFRDAEARERAAEAEARATRWVSEAIAAGDVRAINYFVAQRYVEALRDIAAAPTHKTILMPLEAAGVIGALAGVAELTRDAFSSPAARTVAVSPPSAVSGGSACGGAGGATAEGPSPWQRPTPTPTPPPGPVDPGADGGP